MTNDIKVTELFLIPSSFLVAALGTADTNIHRAAVSLLGLITCAMWLVAARDAFCQLGIHQHAQRLQLPIRTRVLYWLPIVFIVGWSLSLVVHLMLWNSPLVPK
jgi:hypothetical protein